MIFPSWHPPTDAMDASKKDQSKDSSGDAKKGTRARIASVFSRESASERRMTTTEAPLPIPFAPQPSYVTEPVTPPPAEPPICSYPRVSRIGNHEIIWREDALGYAWPTLKHLAPTCLAGLLLVRVKQARALANPSSFGGKQTPYVKLEIGKTVRKTPKLKNAGSSPIWESTQQFALSGTETELSCTVMSKRGMSRDPIGRFIVQLDYLLQLANPGCAINSTAETDTNVDPETVFHESWFEVRSSSLKYAGEVLLRIQFFPDMAKFAEVAATTVTDKKGKKKKGVVAENLILEDIRKGNATKGKVKIFGGTLKAAVAISKHPVPRVVKDCITYLRAHGLDEVGLFRIPGNYVNVETLKKGFDDGIDVSFENAHDCGAVLKLYLRELKEPLIPFAHYEHFLAVQKKYGSDQASHATEDYRILMSSLPQANRDLLGYLCAFLEEVAEHEQNNRMNVKNVAIVFAPNVLRPQFETVGSMTADMAVTIEVIETLIRFNSEIFPPKFAKGGRVARDMRGVSMSEMEEATHADEEAKKFARTNSATMQSVRSSSVVVVDPSASGSYAKPEESFISTQLSSDVDEDYESDERRHSSNRPMDLEEMRKELLALRATNEILKDTVTQLNLQIEDIKAGAAPMDVSPRPKSDSVAHNYYAMREARVGALKTFANQPVSVAKARPNPNDLANSKVGSSGQLLTSVGRTASLSTAARPRTISAARDLDVYEVVNLLRIRDSPSTSGTEIGVLEVGQKVNCLDIRGLWMRHDAGWSMMQSDPNKDGPKKQFLVLHNPISRRTDRAISLAGSAAAAEAAGAPLNPYTVDADRKSVV